MNPPRICVSSPLYESHPNGEDGHAGDNLRKIEREELYDVLTAGVQEIMLGEVKVSEPRPKVDLDWIVRK